VKTIESIEISCKEYSNLEGCKIDENFQILVNDTVNHIVLPNIKQVKDNISE